MGQQSYTASVYVVRPTTHTYTASVSSMRTISYTASVNPVIRPDRFYSGSVEKRIRPAGATDDDWNASVYAHFTPITPDRTYTSSVYTVPQITFGQFFKASVSPVVVETFTQDFFGSVNIILSTNKTYTGSVVSLQPNNDKTYRGSVVVGNLFSKSYTASVDAKQLNINRTYSGSVRPFVDITPAEHVVRDADINELVVLVQDVNSLNASIAAQQAQLALDQTEITELVTILNNMTDKPSCRLSTLSPNSNIPKLGGVTMTCIGFEFIPTCTVHLSQGIISIGNFTPLVMSSNTMSFTLPNFTLVGGLNLTQPISIVVNNPDGQNSETLTFTLAP
jgi:hypothetical protein